MRTIGRSTTPYREVGALSDGGATLLYGFGACPTGSGMHRVLEIYRATAAITGTARTTGFRVVSAASLGTTAVPTTTPEPATIALLGMGLVALGATRHRARAPRSRSAPNV